MNIIGIKIYSDSLASGVRDNYKKLPGFGVSDGDNDGEIEVHVSPHIVISLKRVIKHYAGRYEYDPDCPVFGVMSYQTMKSRLKD